ncbi:MAG: beta-ketoacyl-[acyl-carrier-protein] synthase family protein [Methylophilaceae bacterium]|jgi:3-oxoacyl-[acyl-carrier-protein] synthase II
MTARRVAVTGLGVLSPIGNDPKTFFASLMAGKSGIKRLEMDFVDQLDCKIAAYINDFDPLDHFVKNKAATMDRVTQFAVVASQQALKDSGINLDTENLDRFGVYLGTGMGGAASVEEGYVRLYKDQAKRLKPFTVLMAMNNAASAQVALDFGITGPDLTFCTACSSSSVAIGEAVRQIKHGYTDVMLAGGSEALLTFGTIKAWEALRTLADEDEQNPSASCKPFSGNRSGLVLGEGAGMVVLEDMDRAVARGATIYAEVIGYGSSNDSSHITQPSVEGQARAMRKALIEANINADQLDYINAHGTGTKLNDITETNAIKQVCGNKIPVSSSKSMHGHLMGAAGAVEFVACMMAIQEQALPPTAHLVEPDPDCDLDYVPNIGRKNVKVDIIMSNSFAFGGTSGVLIAKKVG